MPNSILLSTLGSEPQIVTLTLDYLIQKHHFSIDRVIVLHTDPTYPIIQESLKQLEKEFFEHNYYPRHISFVPEVLTDSTGPLPDVTTDHEINAAYEGLYSIIRRLKLSGAQLHLSLAGGRKTMAIFAFAVAQQLFEDNDYIWYLLSSERLRESRQMHVDNFDEIQLVEVPFLNWRVPSSLRQQHHIEGLSLQTPSPNMHRIMRFWHQLSHSEKELVELLVKTGYTNKELASALHKSTSTIGNQLNTIYAKLANIMPNEQKIDRFTLITLLKPLIE